MEFPHNWNYLAILDSFHKYYNTFKDKCYITPLLFSRKFRYEPGWAGFVCLPFGGAKQDGAAEPIYTRAEGSSMIVVFLGLRNHTSAYS